MKNTSFLFLVAVVLIAERQTLAETSGNNLRQVSLGDGALDNVQSVSAENENFGRRRLSIWGWILEMVHCPPGPLGHHCHSGGSSSGSSSSGSSSSGSSSSGSSSSGSSSSGSSSSGSSSGSNGSSSSSSGNGDGSGNSGSNSGSSSSNGSWSNTAVSNDFDYFADTTGGSISGAFSANDAGGQSSNIYMGIGLAIAMAGAFAVYRIINRRPSIPTAHLLDGAVKKRNLRFSRAMNSTDGAMEMAQTNSAGLEGDYVRA